MADTFDPEAHRREVALEDLMMDKLEMEFMAALPEVAKQLKIANLIQLVQFLGPGKSITRDKYLDKAMELIGEP